MIDRLDAVLNSEGVKAEKRLSGEERQMAFMWIVCLTESYMELRDPFHRIKKKSNHENEGEDVDGSESMDVDVKRNTEMDSINKELDEWDQELDKADDESRKIQQEERSAAVGSEEGADEGPSWAMWEGLWVPRPIGIVETSSFD